MADDGKTPACHHCGSPWFEPGLGGALRCCDCGAQFGTVPKEADSG